MFVETGFMGNSKHYRQLVERYITNTASEEELQLFFHLLKEGKLDAYLENSPSLKCQLSELAQDQTAVRSHYISPRNYAVAACLLLALGFGIYFIILSSQKSSTVTPSVAVTSLPQASPGSKKATLLLGDGQVVTLNRSNKLLKQGNTKIIQQRDKLIYQADGGSTAVAYNTITTPRGGEYQLQLPDGTVVWLNAGTSLRYPTAFTSSERVVELNGEAYFEVAKNPAKPFIVKVSNASVKVLGTHFNVMAYADDGFSKTTLAEGSVLLHKGAIEEKLKPGEGGVVQQGSDKITVSAANIDQDLAWKDGFFQFDKTDVKTIMNQIGRWYDVDIRYAGTIPQKSFVGRINRNTNLSDVLAVLRLSDVRFSMRGQTLTVEE